VTRVAGIQESPTIQPVRPWTKARRPARRAERRKKRGARATQEATDSGSRPKQSPHSAPPATATDIRSRFFFMPFPPLPAGRVWAGRRSGRRAGQGVRGASLGDPGVELVPVPHRLGHLLGLVA